VQKVVGEMKVFGVVNRYSSGYYRLEQSTEE